MTVAIPRRRSLPPGLGIIRSRTGSGRKLRSFSCGPQPVEELLDPLLGLDGVGGLAVHPGRARALVTPHPIPRHQQERGIGDEVEQIIEPAMRIITGPTVQLGLDLQYPALRPDTGRAPDRRYSPATSWHSSLLTADLLAPFAMCAPLARSDYYGASAPPVGHQPTTGLPARRLAARDRATPDGSHVHHRPIDEVGAQLYPGSIATPTPQAFSVASSPASINPASELPAAPRRRSCTATRPISARFEPVELTGRYSTGSSRTPSRLACRTRTVWQYQHVPALSGLLPTLPGVSRIRLPSASPGCCDSPAVEVFHPHPVMRASWRTIPSTHR